MGSCKSYCCKQELAALKAENERLVRERDHHSDMREQYLAEAERALAERAGGVKVKALEWEKRDVWYAKCPVSGKVYLIAEEEGRFWPLWDASLPGYNTIEAAKAAAQADYERRILSALTTEPAAPEGQQDNEPRAYIVHAPEDDYYGTGPDRMQFHPLAQHDMDNGYRQTPLYGRPAHELSENTGELIDKMAEAIRGDTVSDDTPWATLSEDRKIGWRGDAERALAVVKDYLTARRPAEQAVTEAMVEAATRELLAHGEFSSITGNNEPNARIAARAALKAAMEAGRQALATSKGG